jgi:DNA polymerase III, alpha subunit
LAGIADGLKVRQLKNNSIMATAFLEDMSGSVGLTIFAAAYTQFRNLLISGEPVTVSGRVSEREDRDPEVVVERVEKIPETAKGKASEKYKSGLYLKVKSLSGKEFEEIRRQLSLHGGSTEVIILCTDTGKKLAVPPSLRITPSETLFNALKSLLGAENVKFIK